MSTVVALGGNALLRAGDRGTAAEQLERLEETFSSILPLLAGDPFVLTHGNGPQVGNELLRQERAAEEVPPLPLYLAVAQTQAEIGALAVAALTRHGFGAACLLTHVSVREDDPAWQSPTKPIGPFYGEQQARALKGQRGWTLVHEQGRGWRRTVPSPTPIAVVELEPIRLLLEAGLVPVACGGGGIPVVVHDGGFRGVNAVIDKDRASAVLAAALGAERLLILTDVPAVVRGFGTPNEEEVRILSADEAESLLPELAHGSMRPKVEAAVSFARSGGETLITSGETLADALSGRAGTLVT